MAVTLWGLFSSWLLFPHLGVPRMLRTATAMLLAFEFVAITAWGFASEDCVERPCGAVSEVARVAAAEDLPALSTVVVALAVAHGLRRRRAGSTMSRA
jgi:hypothetical protein